MPHKALMMCIAATLLAGCNGTQLPVSAKAVCEGVGKELAGAQGKQRIDQEKIDATEERLVRMGCLTRQEIKDASGR